jgi:hypothetical protein
VTDYRTPANAHLPEEYFAMQPDPVPDHPDPAMRVWGWMSPTELEWLRETASTMDNVAEVGSLHGRSTTALLEGCSGYVYAIDPWNDPDGYCLPSFMRSCGHYPNLRPIQGYSPQVIVSHQLPDVDMVFLDGAHDAASVRADIEGWLPKCRKIMCGHDYIENGGFPDVFTVVNQYFGDRVTVAPDTAIWVVEMNTSKKSSRKR